MKVLVSACLCGLNCKYSGGNSREARLEALWREGLAIPVCPEQLGGLPTPRAPAEIAPDGRVIDRDGRDVSAEFALGAEKTLELAVKNRVKTAILKENSPSCGVRAVYDGTFSGKRTPGAGVTAALLKRNGIRVLSETEAITDLGSAIKEASARS